VDKAALLLGDYQPSESIYAYEMPKAVIPNNPFAKGRFRVNIAYTADGYDAPLHEEGPHEFEIA
jgi:hypothetical protein